MSGADTRQTSPETSDAQPEQTSYDIPMAEHLRRAISQDWDPAPKMLHPARPDIGLYAGRRRAALSAKFPGRVIVVPAGNWKPRANDTDYAFRAASSFTWLTGETIADAVLVMTPTGSSHTSALYLREYAKAGEVAYFTSRSAGAIWVGNVPGIAETSSILSVATKPLALLHSDLAPHRSANALVLTGFDPSVDALFSAPCSDDLAQVLDELRLVKDDWEIDRLRDACATTTRGFEDVVRELPSVLGPPDCEVSAGWKGRSGGVRDSRATRSATRRSLVPVRTGRRCTGGATTARSPRVSCCWPTWAPRPTSSTPPISRAPCR